MNNQPFIEGSGLGAPPFQPNDQDAASIGAYGMPSNNLDRYYEALPDTEMTYDEFLHHLKRIGRHHGPGAKAEIGAISEGLMSMGGVAATKWHLGPVNVQKVNAAALQRPRMKAQRQAYEMVEDENGQWVAVPQMDAPRFRRRVELAKLTREEAEDARRAARRERLREELQNA
jgi:hypothetical protein